METIILRFKLFSVFQNFKLCNMQNLGYDLQKEKRKRKKKKKKKRKKAKMKKKQNQKKKIR